MDAFRTLSRWEAQREVKNLMGRYTRALLHKEESRIPELFWSKRQDISLGVNYGWYLGQSSIREYYAYFDAVRKTTDGIMKKLFPQIDLEACGVGYLEMKSLSTDLVEVAADGQSARGMWNCAGQKVEYTPAGPVTYLTYGTFAADFVLEDDAFKLLNLQYLEEICHPQGEAWYEAPAEKPKMEEFSPLANIEPPVPDIPETLWEYYRTDRPMPELPPIPEPYETLSETGSYGCSQEVWV